MNGSVAVFRLILAVAFGVSGIRAMASPQGRRQATRAWRVPAGLVHNVATASALGEVAVAIGLLSGPTAWPSAVLAVGFLAVPVLPAAVELARHGGSGTALATVIRANVLAVPAGVVLVEGRPDAGPDLAVWLSGLAPARMVAVLAAAVVLGAACAGVRLRLPIALPGATPAPAAAPLPAEPAARPAAPALVRPGPALTIGMATYDDFDGVYFTLQALRLYHDLDDTELLVIDNFGCPATRDLVRDWVGGRYVLATDVTGTAAPRDLVFRNAAGTAVLCCDSHVLFPPGVIARLKRYHRDNPACGDLLQGPLVYDDGQLVATHFEPVWREQMWGTWATDPRGRDADGEPFDIPMQGLGVFSCRTDAWLGFHPEFRGFGGEEGYIHEKFRQAGRHCLCLPWLRWMHRFGRPRGTSYPLTVEDKLRNYLLGHRELGLDVAPVLDHFSQYLPAEHLARIAAHA